ncbi:hypothetical protein PV721_28080 [Streptomyces sp. MB09-01]|uniref:hypothetical protein n=1 Tax=Streptomyces sp. MB09-01 TaxID=3028666 RepID=UPI0029BC28D9|nr:hypothetical protein [Streptomyces sp. MB09-01]MDX3538136.1 hypothetical protein [Streptomyces sp. MB09-01]
MRRTRTTRVSIGLVDVFTTPGAWSAWTDALVEGGGGFGDLLGPALLAFPLLVLGLSGFETGVSMMPLVAAEGADSERRLHGRILNGVVYDIELETDRNPLGLEADSSSSQQN